jgi:hypothetical protein
MKQFITGFCLFVVLFFWSNKFYAQEGGQSVYTIRLSDPGAVYFEKAFFGLKADGITDDGPLLQEAINKAESLNKAGIVFLPEGTYCIKTPVNIWKGIRLIGYGKARPLFFLPKNAPGFQAGEKKYMIRFCDRRTPDGESIIDGTPGTLFSGLSNIDFKISEGNPAAIAVRFHVAQHSFLEHIRFDIGSGKAAVDEMGNEIRDCFFQGGEWAIRTGLPSAGWQSLVMDCRFSNQRTEAIESKDAGMTIIRCRFNDVPKAVNILQGNNERLFIRDSRFLNISEAAITIGNYYDPKTQVNLENLQFENVPVSVNFLLLPGVITPISRDSLRRKADGPVYCINSLSHGLVIVYDNKNKIQRKFITESLHAPIDKLSAVPDSDIPLFAPMSSWVNIKDLGAKGDGKTDDTKIFSEAIEKYSTIYVPVGSYLISKTITLKPKTALIGLHPLLTKLVIADFSPYFSDTLQPRPVIITPSGGSNIFNGISIDAGLNPGAIAIKWMAGEKSYLNDVHLPSKHSAKKGEGQYYGLWVTDGGGGVFKCSWFPNELSPNGMFVNNTSTKGIAYMLSIEHHKNEEVKMNKVSNWDFYSLQTEEDLGSDSTFAVKMNDCNNILFTTLYCYRRALMPAPFISAVQIENSQKIGIRGIHNFSSGPFPYDNTVYLKEKGVLVPQQEFAFFQYGENIGE